MVEEKVDAEVLQKLEEEMKNKMAVMQKMLKEIQVESVKSPEELMKKIGNVKDVKVVAEAVREMQDRINEKKEVVESNLKDIQEELDSLKGLKEKIQKEDVTDALKSTAVSIRDKKEALEKAVKELEGLRDEYNRKFFG